MTFMQARNAIVERLEAHIGCPVVLSGQIADMPEYPYCYYSVISPRTPSHSFGLVSVADTPGGPLLRREEPTAATMSFTFCSMNRETDSGYVFGDDEALGLSEKANGFFLLNAHCIATEYGNIVVNDVGASADRSSFFVEDTVRKHGFDVKISYVRTDEMETETISGANAAMRPNP